MNSPIGSALWFRCGGSAIGTSHQKNGTPCQDRAACSTLDQSGDDTLIAVVSDGAGSARYGGEGAQSICKNLSRSMRAYIANGNTISELEKDTAEEWLIDVRTRISERAEARDTTPRQFAATFVALIANQNSFVCIAVGDSILAVQPQLGEWSVPIPQMNGEYASSTVFLTQNTFPDFGFVKFNDPLHRAALFTDGLEKIAFNAEKIIKGEFLDSLFDAISDSISPGRSKSVSSELKQWLASDAVCEHTDDDKTLLLIQAVRPEEHANTDDDVLSPVETLTEDAAEADGK